MRIKHSIEIAAPVARVWKLTLDVEKWPDLTPTITRIEWLSEPPVRVGCQARIKQPGQRAKIWTVTEFEPERCFTWATRSLGLRGERCRNDEPAVDRSRGPARAAGRSALPAPDPESDRNGERGVQGRGRARLNRRVR
jgi:hypothetical protein